MRLKVALPRVLHRRLESHHEYADSTKLLGELIGSEGLPEAHLRVPKEARDRVHVLLPDRVEVSMRPVDSFGLFTAHREREVMSADESQPLLQLRDRCLYIV